MSLIKINLINLELVGKWLVVAFSLLATLFIVGWVLKYSGYGIDFTDQSYHLIMISNPFAYNFSATLFGFVYYPLYLLLDGDIVLLRQANVLITFFLAWALSFVFLSLLVVDSPAGKYFSNYLIAAGVATSSLAVFDSGNIFPNYNSLALQALLITSIGLLLAEKLATRKSLIGWFIIGFGGWLAFMAKPSTALALAVGVFIYLLVSGKLSFRLLLIAVMSAFALLLLSAFMIDGSISSFAQRLQLGFEFAGYLGGGHTLSGILRIDDFQLNTQTKQSIFLLIIAAFTATWGAIYHKWISMLLYLPISFAFFTLITLLVFDCIHSVLGLGRFQGMLFFGVVIAALLVGLVHGRVKQLKSITTPQWAIACLFFIMPHIYTFGTISNYWQKGGAAGIFWLLAGLSFLGPIARERATWLFALPIVLAVQVVSATLLQTGMEQPYRQPEPLRLNDTTLKFGSQQSELILSSEYAAYINDAVTTSKNAGLRPATPVIDLSGQSPGVLYAIGAESIGQAWTIGGYSGSLKLAKAALNLTSCRKIAKAWVLFEPDGPRSVPTELMPSLGADFPEGYQKVGSWQTAEGAGGYAAKRTQELYKPITSNETLRACQALREKEQQ